MYIAKIWCLPAEYDEDTLQELHQVIVSALTEWVSGINDESDMTTLFPPDSMSYGLGTDVFIEIINLHYDSGWDEEKRVHIARAVGSTVSKFVTKAERVVCHVRKLDPDFETVWNSTQEG